MTIGFPKPRPRILDKRDTRLERERQQREVYALVAARDGRRCRCCGRSGSYEAGAGEKALHRHHIQYRSKGGADTTANIVTLCALCHALEHVARQLHIIGTNADSPRLSFEIAEAAVVEAFGNRPLPRHVRIIAERRR
jgi:hypothetical protein